MSNIRSMDEPVSRMAKLMAELYCFMARELIERLGEEEGRASVWSAIERFGKARLESMHEEAFERGLDICPETYLKVRDMPGISWERDPDNPDDVTYCPMQDMWEQLESQDLGAIYCDIDYVLYRGFNMELERPLCKTAGDSCCRFIVKK